MPNVDPGRTDPFNLLGVVTEMKQVHQPTKNVQPLNVNAEVAGQKYRFNGLLVGYTNEGLHWS